MLGEATTADAGADGGLRCGGGGGVERKAPGAAPLLGKATPVMTPRDDGGGGIRDVGTALPRGLGGILTGRGATLMGRGAAAGAGSEAFETLGSFSSPIENFAAQPLRTAPDDSNSKRRYSRTIS